MRISEADPFWERAIKLMRAHKISQEKFAVYIGINHNTLKSWIHFSRIPDAYTASDIADALGVSVEYLVKGVDGQAAGEREKETLVRKNAAADIKKMLRRIKKSTALIG